MITISELIKLVPSLSQAFPSSSPHGRWQVCSLHIDRETLTGRMVLERVLAELIATHGAATGWLCFESAVSSFTQSMLSDYLAIQGPIRYGEWCHEDGMSAGLYLVEPEQWQLVKYRESEGETALRECVVHIGQTHGNSPGDLQYYRYWQHEPDWGFRTTNARFIGFVNGNRVQKESGDERK